MKIKINDKCEKCHNHEGTEQWIGEGGILAFTHGMYQMWCVCCCLKAQIKFAMKQIKNL